jgi:hypothetical protein
VAWLAFSAVTAGVIIVACSTGANDTSACQQIETARCQVASACPANFNLQSPTPDGNAVDACIRFYQTQCLHGLTTTTVPSGTQVGDCVSAILKTGHAADSARAAGDDASVPCGQLVAPETISDCSFLNLVDAGEDGSCTGTSTCAGSTNGIDCCATITLEGNPDGGAYPNCGVSSLNTFCGQCTGEAFAANCTSTEIAHLCTLESDCSNEAVNTQCCQLAGYQACVAPGIASAGLTCL